MTVNRSRSGGGRVGTIPWAGTCCVVDISGDSPLMIRADKSRGRVRFTEVESEALPPGGDTLWVAALPVAQSLARWLTAPFASMHKARKVLPTLLDIELPFAIEDCSYCFLDSARTTEGQIRSLAVAARTDQIETRLAEYRQFAIDPAVLDHEGLAIWTQSLREMPPDGPDTDTPRAVVSLHARGATLLVGRGAEFLGSHALASADPSHINRVLTATFRPKPDRICWHWCGSAAREDRVAGLMQDLGSFWPGPSRVHDEPAALLARGLATRALAGDALCCNLRTGSLMHDSLLKRAGSRSWRAAVVLLTAGLVLCGANIAASALAARHARHLDGVLAELRDGLLGYHLPAKGWKAVQAVRAEAEKRKTTLMPFLRAFQPSMTEDVVSLISIAERDGLTFESLSIQRDAVSLSGTAARWNAWDGVLTYLSEAGHRPHAKPQQIMVDDRIPFTIATRGAGE